MFSVFAKQLNDYFDRRWVLAAFFPSLAFWGVSLIFAIAIVRIDNALHLWKNLGVDLQIIATAAALAWVAFFAFLLNILNLALVRLFEGYWEASLLAPVARFKRARYQAHRRDLKLKAESAAKAMQELERANPNLDEATKRKIEEERENELNLARERFLFFPPGESAVMPTHLGNILRSAEMYALERYGMDAVVLWPRLAPLLPKEFSESIANARMALDFMINLSGLATFLGITWGVYFALAQWWIFVVIALLILLLAWLMYSNALHAARAYGELIKTAFDLYRWNLLDAFHLAYPEKTEEEPELWEKISGFVFRGYPLDLVSIQKLS